MKRINESKLHNILMEAILKESMKSNQLKDYFTQHGGVAKWFYSGKEDAKPTLVNQDGLSDITDDAITYFRAYPDVNSAIKAKSSLTASNGMRRNDFDMNNNVYIYKAKDGTAVLVATNRGFGNFAEKSNKRHESNGWNYKTRDHRYVDDSDTYYYGGGINRRGGWHYDYPSPANDFGIHKSSDYKNMLADLGKNKVAYEEQPYRDAIWHANFSKNPKAERKAADRDREALRHQGRENYKAWRNRSLDDMHDYVKKYWPKQAGWLEDNR